MSTKVYPEGKLRHPLHDLEWVEMLNNTQRGGYFMYSGRRTGKSTRLALNAIEKAIATPYVPVKIIDHHGTDLSNQFLADMISGVIGKLELDHMYLAKHHDGSITLTFGKEKVDAPTSQT